jgi:hypothetical protein
LLKEEEVADAEVKVDFIVDRLLEETGLFGFD